VDKNIYQAPKSQVTDIITTDTKGSPFRAVFLGFVTDIGGSIVTGTIFIFIYALILVSYGFSPEQIELEVSNANDVFSVVGFISHVIGLGFSALGGYVCARIVQQNIYKYAAIVGFCSIIFGVVVNFSYSASLGGVTVHLLVLLSALAGAYFYQFTQKGKV
jgi:hypothetical protein